MFQIYAGPGSPYSHKIRAVFRYRRIPHTWQVPQGGFTGRGTIGDQTPDSPLQAARKGVVPVVQYPDGTYKADSTPIMYDLESLYSQRSILPPNNGIAFLAHLIEDIADEYLPLPMFYFRWTDDAEWCGRRQMIGWNGAMDDAELQQVATAFLERQQAQLGIAAAMQREQVQTSYEAFLDSLESLLKKSLLLFGTRPSFAEFGLYGQLTQYIVDPYVSDFLKRHALRVFQWTHYIDDLSGIEGEWAEPEECITPELEQLIASISAPYFTMMERLKTFVRTDDLAGAVNGPKYRIKCLLALKQELADLDEADVALVRPVLETAGCWNHLQFTDDEIGKATPITPA